MRGGWDTLRCHELTELCCLFMPCHPPTRVSLDMRSTLSLSILLHCVWVELNSCLLADDLGSPASVHGTSCGFVGGCMVRIEKQSRRIERALCMLALVPPAVCRHLHNHFHVLLTPHAEAAVCRGAHRVIMSAYILRPDLLRRSYLKAPLRAHLCPCLC